MFRCECVRLRLCVHAVMVEMQLCEAPSQISSSLFKPCCVLVICVRAVTCTFFMKGFPLLAQAAALDRYSRSHRPMAQWDLHDVSLTEVDSAIFTSLVIISAFSCFSAACAVQLVEGVAVTVLGWTQYFEFIMFWYFCIMDFPLCFSGTWCFSYLGVFLYYDL